MRAALMCGALMLLACGGAQKPQPTGPIAPPEWVARGSAAVTRADNVKVFYGLGTANPSRNPALSRTTADNLARSELGTLFAGYVHSLLKDYYAARAEPEPTVSSEESNDIQFGKMLSAKTMQAATIVERWTDPTTGKWYALVELPLSALLERVPKLDDLPYALKQRIMKNAVPYFQELERPRGE